MERNLQEIWARLTRLWVDRTRRRRPRPADNSVFDNTTADEFKQAAIDYPRNLPAGNRYYLYVKPFDSSRNKAYSAHFFQSFASMMQIMALPAQAKVLDVACGPGWLSEFLARSGYDVTGVDISPDMIQIARERAQAVRFGPWEGQPLQAQFLVHDTETGGLGTEVYHAAIIYDSLHHFPNPRAALDCVFQALKPGGKLYIEEGIKPAPGSEVEKQLDEEMERYGTLEKPFDQPELFDLLKSVGFVDIQAYERINVIVKRKGRKTIPALRDVPVPMTNTILARKPGGAYDSQYPNVLRARMHLADEALPEGVEPGTEVEVSVSLENVGDTLWLSEPRPAGGFVTLGTKLLNNRKHLISDALERTKLPYDVPPGQTVTLTHRFTLPRRSGSYWIKLDLVDELITWFENEGSQPLEFRIRVGV